MGDIEFKERTFEHPLLRELDGRGRTVFQPDQVFEHAVGFDAALHTYNTLFWTVVGKRVPRGRVIDGKWWPAFPPTPSLPSRALNAFLQFKCPQRLTLASAREWVHWGRPYFRFDMDPVQQGALLACAKGLGRNGVVVYAAPAFHTMFDLDRYQRGRAIVSHTHFVEVRHVSGHGRYTYRDARHKGRAFSEPVEVEPIRWSRDLPEWLGRASDRRPAEVIQHAHAAMAGAIQGSPLRELYDTLRDGVEAALMPVLDRLPDAASTIRDFAFALVSQELIDCEWVVLAGTSTAPDSGSSQVKPRRIVDI